MGITTRVQLPSEGHWLYRYDKTSDLYTISDEVNLGIEDTEWDECTNEQKIQFESHNTMVLEQLFETL